MRRRAFLKQTALGAAAGGAAVAAPVFAQEAPAVAWRLASSFPDESPTMSAGAEDVARYVSEVTDGRFTIEIYPAGDLVQPGQILEAVQYRVVDLRDRRRFGIAGQQAPEADPRQYRSLRGRGRDR